ncbi:MAG TPA: NADH-quinone oxidoreductase subunit J [Thermoanaerobaculia bacterium]|nr:NADH-quinone oxidoreductase subunit J [Thermoanaerobaculia bacterium]
MEVAVFLLFALLTVASAIAVIAHPNPVYSTMSLVVTLFATAVLFVMLGAPFLAALQILLYAGAILVLFLFVIMLLNIRRERSPSPRGRVQVVLAAAGAVFLVGSLAVALLAAGRPGAGALDPVPLRAFSEALFARYMLPFQIIGLLLLVAVIAATVIARRPAVSEEER